MPTALELAAAMFSSSKESDEPEEDETSALSIAAAMFGAKKDKPRGTFSNVSEGHSTGAPTLSPIPGGKPTAELEIPDSGVLGDTFSGLGQSLKDRGPAAVRAVSQGLSSSLGNILEGGGKMGADLVRTVLPYDVGEGQAQLLENLSAAAARPMKEAGQGRFASDEAANRDAAVAQLPLSERMQQYPLETIAGSAAGMAPFVMAPELAPAMMASMGRQLGEESALAGGATPEAARTAGQAQAGVDLLVGHILPARLNKALKGELGEVAKSAVKEVAKSLGIAGGTGLGQVEAHQIIQKVAAGTPMNQKEAAAETVLNLILAGGAHAIGGARPAAARAKAKLTPDVGDAVSRGFADFGAEASGEHPLTFDLPTDADVAAYRSNLAEITEALGEAERGLNEKIGAQSGAQAYGLDLVPARVLGGENVEARAQEIRSENQRAAEMEAAFPGLPRRSVVGPERSVQDLIQERNSLRAEADKLVGLLNEEWTGRFSMPPPEADIPQRGPSVQQEVMNRSDDGLTTEEVSNAKAADASSEIPEDRASEGATAAAEAAAAQSQAEGILEDGGELPDLTAEGVHAQARRAPSAAAAQQGGGAGGAPSATAQGGRRPQYNFERLDVSPQHKAELQQVLEDEVPRSHVSWRELDAAAEEAGGKNSAETLLKKKRLNDAEAAALDSALASVSEKIENLRQVQNPTPEQSQQIAELMVKRNAIFLASSRHGSAAGRALNALQKFRKRGMTQEDHARVMLAREFWDTMDDTAKTNLATLDLKNNDAVYEWMRGFVKPSYVDMAMTNFRASIMSGVPTQARNIFGNTMKLASELVARPLAAAIDPVGAKVFGRAPAKKGGARVRGGDAQISIKDYPAAWRGLAEGISNGVAKAKQVLKAGAPVIDVGDTGDRFHIRRDPFQLSNKKAVRAAGKALQPVFRTLGAVDAFFSETAFQSRRYEAANRMARQKGGKQADYLNNPDVLVEANQFAKKATYQDQPTMGTRKLNEWMHAKTDNPVRKAVSAGGQLIVPFTTIPDRVAADVLNSTPAGLLWNAGAAIGKGWTPETAQKMAMGSIGSAFMSLGAYGLATGFVTGKAPRDASERSKFYDMGKTEYSIGGVPFRLLGPWGGAMAIGAEGARRFREAKTDKDKGEVEKWLNAGIGGILGGANYLLDASFAQSAATILRALQEEQFGGKLIQSQVMNIMAGNVPYSALQRNAAQFIDQTVRERPESVAQAIALNTPGLSDTVPPKLDPFGREVTRKESRALAALPRDVPFAPLLKDSTPDPMVAFLDSYTDAKTGKPLIARLVDDRLTLEKGAAQSKLSGEDQRLYQKIVGDLLREAIEAKMESSFFRKLSRERQSEILQKDMDKAREKGQAKFKLLMKQRTRGVAGAAGS